MSLGPMPGKPCAPRPGLRPANPVPIGGPAPRWPTFRICSVTCNHHLLVDGLSSLLPKQWYHTSG